MTATTRARGDRTPKIRTAVTVAVVDVWVVDIQAAGTEATAGAAVAEKAMKNGRKRVTY